MTEDATNFTLQRSSEGRIWNPQVPALKDCWSWESARECLRKTRRQQAWQWQSRDKNHSYWEDVNLWENQHWQKLITCWIKIPSVGTQMEGAAQRWQSWEGAFLGRWEMSLKPRWWSRRRKEDWGPLEKNKDTLPNKRCHLVLKRALNCINRRQHSWTKKLSEPPQNHNVVHTESCVVTDPGKYKTIQSENGRYHPHKVTLRPWKLRIKIFQIVEILPVPQNYKVEENKHNFQLN